MNINNSRIRGLWRARVILALADSTINFNAMVRWCRLPNPAACSRILRKLEREGGVTRTIISVGPPTKTEWHLTTHGEALIASARATIAAIQEKQADVALASGHQKIDTVITTRVS
jgi:DNA-binding HxlR family transcriptional regulator